MAHRQPDILKLAIRQRCLWAFFLLGVVLQIAFYHPWIQQEPIAVVITTLLFFIVLVIMLVSVFRVMMVDGTHLAVAIIVMFFMLAPCIGLLVFYLINRNATRILKRAGLKVGFMGVNRDEAERLLNPNVCSGCGYDLTGNVSGNCPECGLGIQRQNFCGRCGNRLVGDTPTNCPKCGHGLTPPVAQTR